MVNKLKMKSNIPLIEMASISTQMILWLYSNKDDGKEGG